MDQLREHCALAALVDSNERFDPPRCAESTRQAILQEIEDWANSDNCSASMFWLYGGAGAGKSALAQTLAEKFKKLRRLAASFFFSKTAVPTRGNGDQLVPTLVLQLLETFPDLRPLIEDQIRKYPTLFHKSRESQWETLFVEPNLTLASSKFEQGHPLLIVIDGLDECQDADVQCDLLQIIASSIPRLPFPFCFLIASRPESHIVRTFDHHRALQAINVQRYDLSRDPNVDIDIRGFLEQEFADICRVHVLGTHLGPDWPGSEAIDTLVDRSSGHFIYASTVIRYIEHPRRRPDDRLQVILGLSPASVQDRPYAQLDALYTRIFQEVEDIQVEAIRLVLGILYLITERKGLFEDESVDTSIVSIIDNLLGWKPGDLDLLFDSLRSLVILDGGDFHVLHNSLFDYLLDPSRSRGFHLDLGKNHLMMNAFCEYQLIHQFTLTLTYGHLALEYFYDFAYHCYFARYNAELRNYICSLDILYSHKQQLLLELSRHHGVHLPWVSALFYIFRTLRRRVS